MKKLLSAIAISTMGNLVFAAVPTLVAYFIGATPVQTYIVFSIWYGVGIIQDRLDG